MSSESSSLNLKSFIWVSLLLTTWCTTNLNLIPVLNKTLPLQSNPKASTQTSSMMDWSNIMLDLFYWTTKSLTLDVTCLCTAIPQSFSITRDTSDYAFRTILKKTLRTKQTWWSTLLIIVSRTSIRTTRLKKTQLFPHGHWLKNILERIRPLNWFTR